MGVQYRFNQSMGHYQGVEKAKTLRKETQKMWYTVAMSIAKILYSCFRGTLKKAIDDPKRDWDEATMAACDVFFGYTDKKQSRGDPL